MGWLLSGCIRGALLRTTCTSWSRARRGPIGSLWGPVRTDSHLFGLRNLSLKDHMKVLNGNQTMRQSAQFTRACANLHVPVLLEK
eukprot:4806204-Heterocapsa_arctica.AAC.1